MQKYSMPQCTTTSILQYFNTSIFQILQYFNTSINKTQPLSSNKRRGLLELPLGTPTNYNRLLTSLPNYTIYTKKKKKKKKKNLNTTIYVQTLKSHCYKKEVTAVDGECLYTHTPSGWCSGVLANTRWKRGLNTSGCGISSRDPRY